MEQALKFFSELHNLAKKFKNDLIFNALKETLKIVRFDKELFIYLRLSVELHIYIWSAVCLCFGCWLYILNVFLKLLILSKNNSSGSTMKLEFHGHKNIPFIYHQFEKAIFKMKQDWKILNEKNKNEKIVIW